MDMGLTISLPYSLNVKSVCVKLSKSSIVLHTNNCNKKVTKFYILGNINIIDTVPFFLQSKQIIFTFGKRKFHACISQDRFRFRRNDDLEVHSFGHFLILH